LSFRYPAFKRAIIMAEKPTAELLIKVDSNGVKLAGENLENLTKTGKKAEKALKNTGKSAGAIGGPFRAMRGSVQQASYQLQDIAVQAQMGTDAFIILGQQGPQLASIFGPGGAVLGVLIALGAVVGGTLFKALTGTGEAMKELAKDAKTLRDSFDDLGPAAQAYQRFLAAEEIIEGTKNLANLNAELKKGIKTYALGFLATVTNREADEKWTERKLLLNQQIERGTLLLSMKKEAVDGLTTGTEKLIEKLDEELITLGMTNIELAAYKATLAGATEAQIKQAASIQKGIDLKQQDIDKIKEQNKAKEKADKDAIKREEKLEMFFFKANERKQKDEETAAKKLARDKAAAVQMATNTANLGLNELDAMKVKHEALELELKRHLAAEFISKDQAKEAIAGIEREKTAFAESEAAARRQIQLQVIGAAAGAVGQLQGIAEEGSKEAKILFAMQKALAIAQIIVSTELAANAAGAQASVIGGPFAYFATAAGIRAVGYASAGVVAGTVIAGGRALGGQVRGGESYLVGERGPELLTMGTSGRIATNENLKNAVNNDNSNSSNVINVNFSVQANDTAGFDRLLQSRRGQIVGMINQAVNNRGRSSIV
jgi:phosphotransferase system IIA component